MENTVKLVELAKHGNKDAFATLYEQIYKDLYRFALYTLKNPSDAEDVVSEAVIDAYSDIKKLRSNESFKSWIFKIVSNKCCKKIREYRRNETDIETCDLNDCFESGCEENIVVRQLFMELAAEERLIIGLHIFAGYTSKEIAKQLKMNENTVRSKESRALKKLAVKMR